MPRRRGTLAVAAALLATLASSAPAGAAAEAAARRIAVLAPHLAELAYAAGAGSRLVAGVAFTDYPPAAAELPRIGDAFRIDYEALAAVAPDLVLAWAGGTPAEVVERLRALGYRVELMPSPSLAGIAGQIERLGALAGTREAAGRSARRYRERLRALAATAAGKRRLRVFYQVSSQPLRTVTGRHAIGEAMALCGGDNPFAGLAGLAPVVSVESVIAARPEAIIASGYAPDRPPDFSRWQDWPELPASRARNFFSVPADLVSRPGPRLLDGAEAICDALDRAREALDQD